MSSEYFTMFFEFPPCVFSAGYWEKIDKCILLERGNELHIHSYCNVH